MEWKLTEDELAKICGWTEKYEDSDHYMGLDDYEWDIANAAGEKALKAVGDLLGQPCYEKHVKVYGAIGERWCTWAESSHGQVIKAHCVTCTDFIMAALKEGRLP